MSQVEPRNIELRMRSSEERPRSVRPKERRRITSTSNSSRPHNSELGPRLSCYYLIALLLGVSLLPTYVASAKSEPGTGTGTGSPSPNEFLTTSSTITPLHSKISTTSVKTILPPSAASGTTGQSSPVLNKIATVTPSPPSSSSRPSALQDKMGALYLDDNDFILSRGDREKGSPIESPDSEDKEKRQRVPSGHLFQDLSLGPEEDYARNETRERDALQEEGSHHQPVVFIGGAGYIPPSNLRPRPILEAELPWQSRPALADGARYPYPLQSAWDRNYRNPFNMTRVQHIEAECQDDFMKLRVSFNGSFQGLIYSSGFAYDNDCVYVNGTGRDYYEYLIRLNRCGTLGASNHVEGRKEPSKNFMWNTVTVQYNPMIEEEWDEHFKVTCEYGYDFWKTVTFKPFDVEVATGNPVVFTLTPPECYMEVRYGFGASGTRVGGPVRVGDPLTLMIYMRSQFDGFDLVVNDCYAHNGGTKRIQLIDHYGCPVDSKLMSPFRGTWSHTNVYETQVYAYLKTFRFTGSPALYIECDVRMCHGQCPSQPCYWRNVKNIQKRSIEEDRERNATLSESVNLSQALTVLQDQEDGLKLQRSDEAPDSVCLKTGVFTAIFGFGTIILAVLGMVSMITCFRLKRMKQVNDGETSDILRPYSHHAATHSHQHHWSSSSSLAKPRVP